MKIIHVDDDIVVVEKERGMFVHPPENKRIKIDSSQNGMAIVRDLLGQWVYPVHRLDVSTSGVMIYALSSAAASKLARQFEMGTVEKTYETIVRGHVNNTGEIDTPLKRDSNQTLAPALTQYTCLMRSEIPVAGSRHPTTRLSWVRAHPLTGRYHQIRRHFHRISHPVIGDANHGDCRVNRAFSGFTGVTGLLLRATMISFIHPRSERRVEFQPASDPLWEKIRFSMNWEITDQSHGAVHCSEPLEQPLLQAQSRKSCFQ